MAQVEDGIVGIITNHSFLDNPTFRGMRQSLWSVFNQIYVLDLHGNTKKKEVAPDGSKDENVFDIEQGVCISILVRKRDLKPKVWHSNLWGRRSEKYRTCAETKLSEVGWQEITPSSPFYFFFPQNESLRAQYESWPRVTDIFPVNVLGFQTHRDDFAIAFEEDTIRQRARDMIDDALSDKTIREKYRLGSTWKLDGARKQLREKKDWSKAIIECLYHPFDKRWCYFGREFMDRPRRELIEHVLRRDNLLLNVVRQTKLPRWRHVLISDDPTPAVLLEIKDGSSALPLYLYPPEDTGTRRSLFEDERFKGKSRIENIAPTFRALINEKYGNETSPEQILGYIYAVLHSATYRIKYTEFLKIDFPRIPLVSDKTTFKKLSTLGWTLAQVHLLKDIPSAITVDITRGSDKVEKLVYRQAESRIYINEQQYFAPVPENVWNFYIGGYRVLDQYLAARKGRELTLDEKENVMKVVNVLSFTVNQMIDIDRVCEL